MSIESCPKGSRPPRWGVALTSLGLAACELTGGLAAPEAPEEPPPALIEAVRVHPGNCGEESEGPEGIAFRGEPFAIDVRLRAEAPAPSRVLRFAVGLDSHGARDRIVTFDGAEVGTFTACVDGLTLDWPQLADLRVELFEASTWVETYEGTLAVATRDRVDTVVYPRFAHPTRRRGTPVRRGDFVRVEVSLYLANGRDEAVALGDVVTGMVHDGTRAQSWAVRLDRPLVAEAHAISEVYDFHISYPMNTGFGQRLSLDSLSMLVSAIRGSSPPPGTETRALDWEIIPGIAVDVVFVGDFTPEKQIRAASAVIDGASGYLEGAGITLNRSLSRSYTAAEIGMGELAIANLKGIHRPQELTTLAAFQPPKSIERLTVFIVEEIWLPRGSPGAYRGGYGDSTDAKTPFPSPVLAMPKDLGDSGPHAGFQAFAQVAAQRIAQAMGGLEEVDVTACKDINAFLPSHVFNLMAAASGAYSWLLSPCQREKLSSLPMLYTY